MNKLLLDWLFDLESQGRLTGSYSVSRLNDVIIDGSIDISSMELTNIPFNFLEVSGDFIIDDNPLLNLKGAPEFVGGDFSCSRCRFINLIDAPYKVCGNFICEESILSSLEGAPNHVGQDFIINDCLVESLNYSPAFVGGNYLIDSARLITESEIKNVPLTVGVKVEKSFTCTSPGLPISHADYSVYRDQALLSLEGKEAEYRFLNWLTDKTDQVFLVNIFSELLQADVLSSINDNQHHEYLFDMIRNNEPVKNYSRTELVKGIGGFVIDGHAGSNRVQANSIIESAFENIKSQYDLPPGAPEVLDHLLEMANFYNSDPVVSPDSSLPDCVLGWISANEKNAVDLYQLEISKELNQASGVCEESKL
ncbi:MAG: hypothetical protein IBX55_00840 [Methyloprofundus sp.]|nr:hypothetical protein [Methyloprofundus sp.]